MSPRLVALALAASLVCLSVASAASPRSCGHLQARPTPANPKDVFRSAEWVCHMTASRSPGASSGADAKPRSTGMPG